MVASPFPSFSSPIPFSSGSLWLSWVSRVGDIWAIETVGPLLCILESDPELSECSRPSFPTAKRPGSCDADTGSGDCMSSSLRSRADIVGSSSPSLIEGGDRVGNTMCPAVEFGEPTLLLGRRLLRSTGELRADGEIAFCEWRAPRCECIVPLRTMFPSASTSVYLRARLIVPRVPKARMASMPTKRISVHGCNRSDLTYQEPRWPFLDLGSRDARSLLDSPRATDLCLRRPLFS